MPVSQESREPSSRRRGLGLAALAAVVVAYASLVQGGGANQNSHYALVRALAAGTAVVDRTQYEVGDVGTPDVAYANGHYYAAKAPGLAFLTVPEYRLLAAVGYPSTGDPAKMLWALGLLGTVLPVAILLLLVRSLADSVAPGFGVAAAVTLGLGTLLFPFGTMFFSHALAATLGLGAFALLWHEREGPPRIWPIALAGLVCGLAVTVEYPQALVGAVLGLYALARRPRVRRALAFAGGVGAGVVPLLLYDAWAFGSVTHLPYAGWVTDRGVTGHARQAAIGDFLPHSPHPTVVVQLLFSIEGLLVSGPVVAAGAAGTILLYRRGKRAEALAIAGVGLLLLLYISSLGNGWSWGGVPPGPRYLIPALPFLAIPLALAFREIPAVTAAIGAVSIAATSAITATHPMAAWDGRTLDRILSGRLSGYSDTVADLVGVTGWYDVAPLFLALGVAVVSAALATPWPSISRRDLAAAGIVLVAWAALARTAWHVLLSPRLGQPSGAALIVLLVAALVALVIGIEHGRPRRRVATPLEAQH